MVHWANWPVGSLLEGSHGDFLAPKKRDMCLDVTSGTCYSERSWPDAKSNYTVNESREIEKNMGPCKHCKATDHTIVELSFFRMLIK